MEFLKRYYNLFVVAVFLSLALVLYCHVFSSPFYFDDRNSITANFNIRNIRNLRLVWDFWPTRFISYLSFALNYHFHKLDIFGYHLVNIIIHFCSALLVWAISLLSFSAPAMKNSGASKYSRPVSFFIGLLFLVHPIQTQAVTYIVQRSASLAALFYLASLSFYIRSRLILKEKSPQATTKLYYAASLFAAFLAMFTKEMAISLPFIILLYEFYFLKSDKEKINLKYVKPFFILLLIIPLVMWLSKSVNFIEMRRANESVANISVWNYALTQFKVVATYIRLLFLPLNQNLDYDYPLSKALFEFPTLAGLLFLVSVAISAFKMFSKYRFASFGIFWFFLTLLPESSIVPIKDVIFEHRLYLPMVGFSFFLMSIIYCMLKAKTAWFAIIISVLLTASYATMTYKRNLLWQDEERFLSDIISKSPGKARAYNNRGDYYSRIGEYDKAVSDFNKAMQLDNFYADAYYNLGTLYAKNGDFKQAIFNLNKAINVDPNDAEAYMNRGVCFYQAKELGQSISDFKKALVINKNYVDAYVNLGKIYSEAGNTKEAMGLFKRALEIDPFYLDAYTALAILYGKTGNAQEIIDIYEKLARINPGHAQGYDILCAAYGQTGNFKKAIISCNKALRLNPDLASAHNNLAVLYYNNKEYGLAIEHCDKASHLGFEVNPDFLEELRMYRK